MQSLIAPTSATLITMRCRPGAIPACAAEPNPSAFQGRDNLAMLDEHGGSGFVPVRALAKLKIRLPHLDESTVVPPMSPFAPHERCPQTAKRG